MDTSTENAMSQRNLHRSSLAAAVTASLLATPAMAGDCDAGKVASDGWIDTRLETAYLFNPSLNDFTITTAVEQGVVSLAGSVRSDIDKDLAGEIARSVDGVREVENALVVNPGLQAATQQPADGFVQKVSDATTTAMVKARLVANDNIRAGDIDVDTSGAVVRLSGTVASPAQKDLAEFIARNTSGVDSVVNQLAVAPGRSS
jgi:osmotically-inducible protein OsmY